MSSKLAFAEHEAADVTVLTMTGQMLLDDGDLAFRQRIHDLVDRRRVKIVLEMAGVTYRNSAWRAGSPFFSRASWEKSWGEADGLLPSQGQSERSMR